MYIIIYLPDILMRITPIHVIITKTKKLTSTTNIVITADTFIKDIILVTHYIQCDC